VERFEALRPTLFCTLATAYIMVALAAKSQNYKMGIWEIDWAPVVQCALEGKLALHPHAVDSQGGQGGQVDRLGPLGSCGDKSLPGAKGGSPRQGECKLHAVMRAPPHPPRGCRVGSRGESRAE
jgi:hypothetical protein